MDQPRLNRSTQACIGSALRVAVSAGLAALLLTAGVPAAAQLNCGPMPSGGYGPFDYRTDKDKLEPVEKFHFTPPVEALIRGATAPIGSDIQYVLDKFPNHHRALLALTRLAARGKTQKVPFMDYPVECFFDRALRFRKDDTVARTMFAMYLITLNRKEEAANHLEVATTFAGDNPFTHQSIGLVFLDLGLSDKALERGLDVRRLGLNNSELIKRLKTDGRWPAESSEPMAAQASVPTEAASAAVGSTLRP